MLFYTYLWRDALGVPFYVGKGAGKRAGVIHSRSLEFRSVYDQGGCAVEIVDEFILESQAHAHEVELIERYGRREFGGLLVNKTDGGDGMSNPSLETRAKLADGQRGRPKTAGAIAKTAASWLGRKHSTETRLKIRAANLGKTYSPEVCAKVRAAVRMAGPRVGDHKGVQIHKAAQKWAAEITVDGKKRYLGLFPTPEDAAHAYDEAAYAAWGNDCYLNFPLLRAAA